MITREQMIDILIKELEETNQFGEVYYKKGEGILISLLRLTYRGAYATITEEEIDYQFENYEEEE